MRLGGRHNMPPPVRAKFEDRSSTRLRNIEGVPKFRNWVTYPRRRQLKGQFVVHGQELLTAYVRAKFEDLSLTRLRNIEGVPKFRNWVTSPGHAQFGPICGPGARTAHGLCACQI